jgi:hypothetical protein
MEFTIVILSRNKPNPAKANFKGDPWTPLSIARAHHALRLYALWAATPEMVFAAVSGVAAQRAGGLRPSYHPLGYPMPYAPAYQLVVSDYSERFSFV